VQSADFPDALLASCQVPFEPRLVPGVQGIHRVGTRQGVRLGPAASHRPTPRQSGSRIRPSRIRV